MTDIKNGQSFRLDRNNLSDTQLTIDENIILLGKYQLKLKMNARGFTDWPHFHTMKGHWHKRA